MASKVKLSKEDNQFVEKIWNKAGKAINQYEMIGEDDEIMVAVSGGKDSLALLEILATRRNWLPINYTIHAVHIITQDVPYVIDKVWLSDFCKDLNVHLHFVETYAGIEEKSGKKKPCFICSWNRRKELFRITEKLGIKKLATGHHLDDALETLFINMAYHGTMTSIPPTLSMFDGALQMIRPLILLTDAELKRYAEIKGFKSLKQPCPYEDTTMRTTARKLVDQFDAVHKKARFNLFKSMSNIDTEYLPW